MKNATSSLSSAARGALRAAGGATGLSRPIGARGFLSSSSLAGSANEAAVQQDSTRTFPNERHGFNYATNWSLAAAGITVSPGQVAHGNLSSRRFSKILKKPSLKLPKSGKATLLTAGFSRPSGEEVSWDVSDDFASHVRSYLSNQPALFVQDAAVSSARGGASRAVSVTDDATVGLMMKNLLERIPSGTTGGRDMIILAAPEAPIEQPTLLVAADENKATVVMAGLASFEEFQQSLVYASAHVTPGFTMGCDVYASSSGKSALVFGGSSTGRSQALSAGGLFASAGAVWGEGGVSRLFSGACVAGKGIKTEATDVKIGTQALISRPSPNTVAHPSVAVFVGGKEGLSVGELFAEHSILDGDADTLEKLVSEHNVDVKVVKASDEKSILAKFLN